MVGRCCPPIAFQGGEMNFQPTCHYVYNAVRVSAIASLVAAGSQRQ
jgi:hypothetical protein